MEDVTLTTIATNSKQIAFDSQSQRGDTLVNVPHMKMKESQEHYFFYSGVAGDIAHFINAFFGESSEQPGLNLSAFIVCPDKSIWLGSFAEDGELRKDEVEDGEIYALGSGGGFAISAMDLGKSPAEAVAYAATRDVYTGGDVHLFDIKTMELIR